MKSHTIQNVPLCPRLIMNPPKPKVSRPLYPKHEEQQHVHDIKHHKGKQTVVDRAMYLRKYSRHISLVPKKISSEDSEDTFLESNCTPVSKKETNCEDGSEEFRDRHCSSKRKRDVADGITDVTPATKIRTQNTHGEDKPELGALTVQPAPPQDTESVAFVSVGCQTVQQCFKPIKIEPPDEPVMGDVTPPENLCTDLRETKPDSCPENDSSV
ncbi:uncharacterized protein LOC114457450 [Gouania willdenowi]|uniref:uncharacterized protein LOC114457450 n=1 Tax=Gouania willdenowi TaxID=441366 RepID=UPI0010555AC2|nr:uncharacterized protein LOC114457450 [Gouania willdenowi]